MVNYKAVGFGICFLASGAIWVDSLFKDNSVILGPKFNEIYPPEQEIRDYLEARGNLDRRRYTLGDFSALNYDSLNSESLKLKKRLGDLNADSVGKDSFKRRYATFNQKVSELEFLEENVQTSSFVASMAFALLTGNSLRKRKPKDLSNRITHTN